MQSILKIAFDILIMAATVFTGIYLYRVYGDEVRAFFSNDEEVIVFVENLAIEVSVANTEEERRQGLSGIESLDELEGKLFIFDEEGFYGIWMRDMRFPIDILFVNNEFEIIEIVRNVSPDTFPKTFTSDEPARFVLEMNAFFADSFKIKEGDRVTIPPRILPADLRENLRE